jgi:chromosome segregation ATPase
MTTVQQNELEPTDHLDAPDSRERMSEKQAAAELVEMKARVNDLQNLLTDADDQCAQLEAKLAAVTAASDKYIALTDPQIASLSAKLVRYEQAERELPEEPDDWQDWQPQLGAYKHAIWKDDYDTLRAAAVALQARVDLLELWEKDREQVIERAEKAEAALAKQDYINQILNKENQTQLQLRKDAERALNDHAAGQVDHVGQKESAPPDLSVPAAPIPERRSRVRRRIKYSVTSDPVRRLGAVDRRKL